MSEVELILKKLKIVSEEKENGMYLCDKEHSKILLDYIQQKENTIKKIENDINNIKDIVKKQPSDDPDTDLWIQIRMNGLLFIINEGNK